MRLSLFQKGAQALLKEKEQYKSALQKLNQKGLLITQCENSVEEQYRTKDGSFDFVQFVPDSIGEKNPPKLSSGGFQVF